MSFDKRTIPQRRHCECDRRQARTDVALVPLVQRRVLPKVIAIDEFKDDAGNERFQTIIVDVEKKEIIEILPDRRVATIEEYFRNCDTGNVQIVLMDMSRAFKNAVKRAFGNPMIFADRFHFMRQGILGLGQSA